MKIMAFFLAVSLPLLEAEPREVRFEKLQKRGKVGSQLTYIPNQDAPFTGKAVSFYSNGEKEWEGNYKDGKLEGFTKWWYENGQKGMEGNWRDGKKEGLWTDWYENGQKQVERNYKDGKLMEAKSLKPNGEKCPVTNVKYGDGVMVWYKDDATILFRSNYNNGEEVVD